MSRLTMALLLLVASLVLHMVEEVTQGFRQKLPLGEMPRWLFISLNVLIYSYAAVMLVFSITNDHRAVPMAWLFTIGMTLNGIGHLGYMLIQRSYFPGGWTAGPLLLASLNTIRVLLA